MGRFLEDLWDHEGYGARPLPDGTRSGTWTAATAAFSAHVAACSCGWHGEREHPQPTAASRPPSNSGRPSTPPRCWPVR
jgi:hypothetical protein